MRYLLLILLSCCAYAADPQIGLGPAPTTSAAPSGSAGGDLTGTYPGPTVGVVSGATSITDTGLTAGRVIYSGTGGLLTADANFTDNGASVVTIGYTTVNGGNTTSGALVVSGGEGVGGNLTVANKFLSASSYTALTGAALCEMYQSGGTITPNAGDMVLQTSNAGTRGFYFVTGSSPAIAGQIGGTAPTANTFSGTLVAGRNNAAADTAGFAGETIKGTGTTSYTNYTTTATYQQIDTASLTAGKWHIFASGTYSSNGATTAAGGQSIWAISTTNNAATGASEGSGNITYIPTAILSLLSEKESVAGLDMVVNISATTSYYLVSQAAWTATAPQFVGSIRAERMP